MDSSVERLNFISDFSNKSIHDGLAIVVGMGKSAGSSLNTLNAIFSQKPVPELIVIFQNSGLIDCLTTMRELIESEILFQGDVQDTLSQIFANFSDLRKGKNFLFGALALVTLCNIPTNSELSSEQTSQIEGLKHLVRRTLFDDSVVIHLMDVRDSKELELSRCPCRNCIAKYLLSIGWYRVLQDKMDTNLFDAIEG
jgi:hypothetical protein